MRWFRNRGELGVAGLLLAAGIYVLLDTPTIRITPGQLAIGPRFFPYMVGAFLTLVAAGLIVGVVRSGSARPDTDGEAPAERPGPAAVRVAGIVAVAVVHALLLNLTGYVIAATVLFWGAATLLGARRPVRDGIIALAVASATYALFVWVLQVPLPNGPFGGDV
ncbi:MAG: tripartite tricarboxylate transporter TctB family protein [Streptosporangiales bacterium]|nr:tripartite tricarboxylate transporter TctB family protein [Streptosporangiales bacterium]